MGAYSPTPLHSPTALSRCHPSQSSCPPTPSERTEEGEGTQKGRPPPAHQFPPLASSSGVACRVLASDPSAATVAGTSSLTNNPQGSKIDRPDVLLSVQIARVALPSPSPADVCFGCL